MANREYRVTPNILLGEALDYAWAADVVISNAGERAPPLFLTTFLLGRSFELALKSFLLHSGLEARKLASRKLGHNIDALYRKARDMGLAEVERFREIDGMCKTYAEKLLEYPELVGYLMPHRSVTRIVLHTLLNTIAKNVWGSDIYEDQKTRARGLTTQADYG